MLVDDARVGFAINGGSGIVDTTDDVKLANTHL